VVAPLSSLLRLAWSGVFARRPLASRGNSDLNLSIESLRRPIGGPVRVPGDNTNSAREVWFRRKYRSDSAELRTLAAQLIPTPFQKLPVPVFSPSAHLTRDLRSKAFGIQGGQRLELLDRITRFSALRCSTSRVAIVIAGRLPFSNPCNVKDLHHPSSVPPSSLPLLSG
jgi:hypothetical protein